MRGGCSQAMGTGAGARREGRSAGALRRRASSRPLMLALACVLVLMLAGCRHDMYNQPRYKPLRPSAFFPNGMSARPIPAGTVARGHLDANPAIYQGRQGTTLDTQFPLPVTMALLKRGQQRFDIYCSPCHSVLGDGNGIVVQRGYTRPPTYHSDYLRNAPVGHFFDVITNGWGAMPDYREQVPPLDRWAIIAYIRALQLSQNAPLADVPPQHRAALSRPAGTLPPVYGKRGMHQMEIPETGATGP